MAKKKETKYVGAHLKPELFYKLEEVCAQEDRTKNYMVNKILEDYFNEDPKNVSGRWDKGVI